MRTTAVFRVLAFQCLERKFLSRDILERKGWTTSLEHKIIIIAESGKFFSNYCYYNYVIQKIRE